jgi:hypothetical protein
MTYADPTPLTDADLQSALNWANIAGKPSTFPPSAHTHTVADLPVGTTAGTIAAGDDSRIVNALSAANAALTYAPLSHTHSVSQLTQSGATTNQVLQWNGAAWVPATISSGGTWGSINGSLPNQTDLQNAFNLKANLASPTFTGTVSGITAAMVGAPSGSGSSTGTNTGDNAVNSLYSGLVSNATHTGDATGATMLTVSRINGQSLAALTTGLLKNTTTTGVPSIAVAGTDYLAPGGALGTPLSGNLLNCTFPTLNQSTTGNAATATLLQTARAINGVSFNGGSDVMIYDATKLPLTGGTLTGALTITQSAANTSILTSTGYSLTGSSSTNLIDIAGTLNTTGNPIALKIALSNTASGATTKFASFLAGSSGTTEVFSVSKSGSVNAYHSGGSSATLSWVQAPTYGFDYYNTGILVYTGAGVYPVYVTATGIKTTQAIAFTGGVDSTAGWDTYILRDAANTIATRNGANAQRINLYGTYTDSSNYRRLYISSTTAGAFTLGVEGLGTGASGNTLALATGLLAATDNTYDVGAAGASRFRNMYLSGSVSAGYGTHYFGYCQINGSGGFTAEQNSSFNVGAISYGKYASTVGRVSADGGFRVRNVANNADTDFWANNITASGQVIVAGAVTSTFQTLTSNPSTLDLSASQSRLIKNTTSGTLAIWANDGGTIKSVSLVP